MGVNDDNRIIEVRNDPPRVILEIGARREQRVFSLSHETSEALSGVLSEKPFGKNESGEYSYWLRGLEQAEGRDWLIWRGRRSDFKIGVRVKLGKSRSLRMLPCTEDEYDSLRTLFPADGLDA